MKHIWHWLRGSTSRTAIDNREGNWNHVRGKRKQGFLAKDLVWEFSVRRLEVQLEWTRLRHRGALSYSEGVRGCLREHEWVDSACSDGDWRAEYGRTAVHAIVNGMGSRDFRAEVERDL